MKTGYDKHFNKIKKTGRPVDIAKEVKKSVKQQKPKRSFPFFSFICFLFMSILGFLIIENFDWAESQFKKIEITMGMAVAEETKPATSKQAVNSESVKTPPHAEEKKKPASEADYLFKLSERKKELDQREEALNKFAEDLAKQKEDIESKLKNLESVRSKISLVLQERIKADETKIETLVQVYSNMKPQQAAKVFEVLDEDLVIEILSKMKKKNAADIMNMIKPEKAQVFSEKFSGYRMPASSK